MTDISSYKHKVMTLKQFFIQNLKEFRKKEGLSQMKLAEYCNTAPSYIGQIETGLRFSSFILFFSNFFNYILFFLSLKYPSKSW